MVEDRGSKFYLISYNDSKIETEFDSLKVLGISTQDENVLKWNIPFDEFHPNGSLNKKLSELFFMKFKDDFTRL